MDARPVARGQSAQAARPLDFNVLCQTRQLPTFVALRP
ncbi:hypothetical protein ANK1_2046 [plant metagenome]|uniref:Uncharacterized protein n=1 Tax=plant metagenome TaxID=1297885 RepID=A0A484THL5_9ZZZZ